MLRRRRKDLISQATDMLSRLDEACNSYNATSSDGETDEQRVGDPRCSKDTTNLAERKGKTATVSDQIKQSAADVEPNLSMPSTSSDSKGLKKTFPKLYTRAKPSRSSAYSPAPKEPHRNSPPMRRSETTPLRREPQRTATYQPSPESHRPTTQRSETNAVPLKGSGIFGEILSLE